MQWSLKVWAVADPEGATSHMTKEEKYHIFAQTSQLVGSVKVNFLSYRYRADKSTIFGIRGLWGLTINSGRGATLKYL